MGRGSEKRESVAVMVRLTGRGPGAAETSSYAGVMKNKEVKQQVDSVAEPIQRNYQSLINNCAIRTQWESWSR